MDALTTSLLLLAAVAAEPSLTVLDPKAPKATAFAADGKWAAELRLEVQLENAEPKFQALADEAVSVTVASSAPATPAQPDLRFVTLNLSGSLPAPPSVYLHSPGMKEPLRVEIWVNDPSWMTPIVWGAAVAAFICVVIGFLASGADLSDPVGQQSWTFESWATNLTVAGGALALVLKLVPAGSPAAGSYMTLSAALAVMAAISPPVYNLTTRLDGGVRKGKVSFFLVSAFLTGLTSLAQVELAGRVMRDAAVERLLAPSISLMIQAVVQAVAIGLAIYLGVSTRDTIAPASSTRAGATKERRTAAGGVGFPAL